MQQLMRSSVNKVLKEYALQLYSRSSAPIQTLGGAGYLKPQCWEVDTGKVQSQLAAILAEMAISHLVRDPVSKSKIIEENVQP